MLLAILEKSGDAALGIHAGERVESADFGVVHHAVRNCPDVRRALLCTARYLRLLDDNLESPLTREFTLSAAQTLGSRGAVRAMYVWRKATGLVESFVDDPTAVGTSEYADAIIERLAN